MNSEKRRSSKRRSLENGRDLLAKYKASHRNESKQTSEASDEDLIQNDSEQSFDHSLIMTEDTSFKDTTQSSISVSEGEGDGDVECMAGRVAELKAVMHGQKAMLQMLTAEMENIGDDAGSQSSSHSQNSSTQYKDIVQNYRSKIKDFDRAVTQRDTLISNLQESLEKTIEDRDAYKNQLNALRAIYVPPQEVDGPIDTQKRISDLEQALVIQIEMVKNLNSQLVESSECINKLKNENDKHDEKVEEYKNIIYQLNEQIRVDTAKSNEVALENKQIENQRKEEVLQIQRQMQIILDRFANDTKSKAALHQKEIQELESKHESKVAEIKQNYEEQYKTLFERYNTELPELESKHAKELQVFQSQSIVYKQTIEALELDLDNQKKSNNSISSELNSIKRQLVQCREDKDIMKEQIKLHKVQIDELTAKYVAASSVLNSRESIERSLEEALLNVEALKRENDDLKCQYDDISAKFAAAQAMIENNQTHERFMHQRAIDMDKSLSRFSGISFVSEHNTTSYATLDDTGIRSHIIKQNIEEKELLEKKLVDRITNLEDSLKKVNKELEEANIEKKSYEKELKETRNKCEKIMSELKSYKESNCTDPKPFQGNFYFSSDTGKISKDIDEKNIESWEKQIEMLKQIIQQKDLQYSELDNKLKNTLEEVQEYKKECKSLKYGLKNAWTQCAAFGDKMDQTLGINDSKFDKSATFLNNIADLVSSYGVTEKSLCDKSLAITEDNSDLYDIQSSQNLEEFGKKLDYFSMRVKMIDLENQKLKDENTKLLAIKSDLEKRHAKEMEELRTYFEEKCVQMEKQYSEEIFSQQSKKMSDDSEVDEMADDLFYGSGAGDGINLDKESDHFSRENTVENSRVRNNELEDINRNSFMTVNQLCQTEWDTTGENGELIELRAAYSHQLEEQVALAKLDIVNALQEQIQALIAVEADTEENWPPELLELRNKFTNNAKREIEKLKEAHQTEICQLKEEHSRIVAKTIESYKEKINKLATDIDNRSDYNDYIDTLMGDNDVVKQRDNLYRTCVIFKGLIQELVKYFSNCEEELNNTLISEVLKRQLNDNEDSKIIEKKNQSTKTENVNHTLSSPTSPKMKIKRVHFAPQANQISTILKKSPDILFDLTEDKNDIAEELKIELEKCLQRLKTESAQLFGFTQSPGESISDALSKQIAYTTKINEELTSKLLETETTIEQYEEESRELKLKIMELQQKLIAIDNSKEIISEGYGEQDTNERDSIIEDFSQLHERARIAITSGAGDNSYLLQLIDELCRHHDKQTEEIKKEKEDLQQQIEAADKQLRATRKFLEEQATEREVERDDAARQVQALKDQLKERDREKERDLRITSEHSLSPESSVITPLLQVPNREADVEALELQVREMSSIISDMETKKVKVESDLKDAVAKIWELRGVIRKLEDEIETKNKTEKLLTDQVAQKNETILSQSHKQQDLIHELEARNLDGDGELSDHIFYLQEELRRHKLSTEHFNVNSTALKQMKSELQEMLNHLDKKTKELETLFMCGSNLSISQPSEDISIRDQIDATRCITPDDPNAPPILPLDQLLKLKEKLLKHTRAEEVAFKRIKDLDMQLSALKIQNEELQAEQEILQQYNSEQLLQIETMRGRLEQQKQSEPFAQRQVTSKLESQLHEANTQLYSMKQNLANKDIMLKEVTSDLERARQLLQEKQDEVFKVAQTESNTIQELKTHIEVLEHEKKVLESNLKSQERKNLEIPVLIDSMLADKNEEIDHLKEQLSKKDKQLEALISLQIDENHVGKINEPKNSARTLSDVLSIHSECEEVSEAIRETPKIRRDVSHNMSNAKFPGLSVQYSDHLDGSPIPSTDLQQSPFNVPPLELNRQSCSTLSPQHLVNPQLSLPNDSIRSESDLKSPSLRSSTNLNGTGSSRKSQNSQSRKSDRITPVKVNSQLVGSGSPKPSIQDLENQLKAIHTELQAKSSTLSKREMELDILQKRLDELRAEFKDSIDALTRDKKFYQEQYELSQESENKIKRDLVEVENDLKVKTEELQIFKERIQTNEKILHEVQTENATLKKDIKRLRDENRAYQMTICEKTEELKNLKQIIFEKDITIETFKTRNEEIENENKQLYEFKTKFESCRKNLIEREKDQENHYSQELIQEKDREIHHLQEYIKEKDKVIKQMSDDSKSLQRSLETIQNKMKETGNVVELRKKLKEARLFNDELTKMVGKLKRELEAFRDESLRQETEGTEIEDMVKRELDLSADLDKKILEAIDNDCERIEIRDINSHHLLTTKPVEKDLETIMREYTDIRRKLKQANKVNERLNTEKYSLEVQKDILKSKVVEYENRILQIKADFEIEWKKNASLSRELSNKKTMTHKLEMLLQEQMTKFNFCQQENSDIIKNLRLKLTSSLDSENDLRNELANLRQHYKILESKLNTLKESVGPEQTAVISTSPVLKEDEQNNLLLTEKYEMAARQIVELNDTLKGVEIEKKRIENQLAAEIAERENLLTKIVAVEESKDYLEIELKRTKKELKNHEQECDWLQKKIRIMTETEEKLAAQQSNDQTELKRLKIETKNLKEVMKDLEADHEELKRQLAYSQTEQIQSAHIIRALRKLESDLQKKITASKKEEEKLKEVIADLQNELRTKCKRELELSKELLSENNSNETNNNTHLIEKISELTADIARYSSEKGMLHDKLIKAREETEKYIMKIRELETLLTQSENNEEDREMTIKFQQLYAKYLRTDSKRKALVFQKRYLLCIIGGYQLTRDNTLSVIAKLTSSERSYVTEQTLDVVTKCPKSRFRSAVLLVMAIRRLKWMVQRWKTGRRKGANTFIGNPTQLYMKIEESSSPAKREGRRPDNENPGTIDFDYYAQRFFTINRTLGLAMSEPETKTMPFK